MSAPTHMHIVLAFASLATAALACAPGKGDGVVTGAQAIEQPPEVRDALYDLGQALFFDKLLSGNRDISCATCHHPGVGTDDDLALSLGVGGEGLGAARTGGVMLARNAPALFNLHMYPTMFWDSRVKFEDDGSLHTPAGDQLTSDMQRTFEYGVVSAQAMFPVTSTAEMRGLPGTNELANLDPNDFVGIWSGVMTRLGQVPAYVEMFEAAYPGTPFSEMTFAHAANAVAGFEIRAFARMDSPYQRYLQGDEQAMTAQEIEGMHEFTNAGCAECHSGPLLSNFEHHNTALAQFGPGSGDGDGFDDYGFERVTGRSEDRYRFRTTPLINVALTGPYGHAGQFESLLAFVSHYRRAENNLRQYDLTEHVADVTLAETLVDNTDALIETIDPLMELETFNNNAIARFLGALTADDADDLSDTIPDAVPSGLSID